MRILVSQIQSLRYMEIERKASRNGRGKYRPREEHMRFPEIDERVKTGACPMLYASGIEGR